MEPRRGSDVRCPVCGEGVLGDIAYDDRAARSPRQASDSREVLTFSCGHEVEARRLAEAARDDPNVEHRRAEETVGPVETEGGRG
jgi:hypothetical protein